jgi:SAM-dependent methyltransferase
MNVKETTKVFSNIYEKNLWKNGSGPGSSPKATDQYRSILTNLIVNLKVKTVLDYGCGDWQFSHLIPWNNLIDNYLGVDIVDSVISENIKKYKSSKVNFQTVNEGWNFSKVDLIICKDVLQHLPNAQVQQLLEKMQVSSKFMIITNDVVVDNEVTNSDCFVGKSRPINLSLTPWDYSVREKFTWDKTKNRIKETVLISNE